MKEREIYVPVKNILIKKFESMGGKVHIENTSDGNFSRSLKEVLDIETVNILRVEKLRPDLTGYYEENGRKEIIIVEVKAKEMTLMNISQSKTYANIFNAHHCILVSSEPLGREKRMFIRSKGLIHRDYREKLVIAWYHIPRGSTESDITIELEVLRDLYHETLPKPFGIYQPPEDVITVPPKSQQDARERPPHHRTWEARVEWTSPRVKKWVETVKRKILTAVPNAIHGPRKKQINYFFYTQEPQVHRNIFAVIMIQKQKLRVRFRLPENFVDSHNITKLYKGWFFSKGQERGVEIGNQQDLDLIDDYISIAYDYTTSLQHNS